LRRFTLVSLCDRVVDRLQSSAAAAAATASTSSSSAPALGSALPSLPSASAVLSTSLKKEMVSVSLVCAPPAPPRLVLAPGVVTAASSANLVHLRRSFKVERFMSKAPGTKRLKQK
jgi:hypothetical protein